MQRKYKYTNRLYRVHHVHFLPIVWKVSLVSRNMGGILVNTDNSNASLIACIM